VPAQGLTDRTLTIMAPASRLAQRVEHERVSAPAGVAPVGRPSAIGARS
jgi:hypothetical protein